MAITYTQIGVVSSDGNFVNRVAYALTVGAVAVIGESPATAKHAGRMAFANKVIWNQVDAASITKAVLTQLPQVTADSATDYGILDTDLQAVINNNWNVLAGI